MSKIDTGDVFEFLDEHKISIGMVVLITVAGGIEVARGGFSKLAAAQARQEELATLEKMHKEANKVFLAQSCSFQFLERKTRTSSLQEGDTVIDPMSITVDNPEGTPFASGTVCSLDGSVWKIEQGKAKLIGSSPKIRDHAIASGAAAEAKKMEAYAQQIYNNAKSEGL